MAGSGFEDFQGQSGDYHGGSAQGMSGQGAIQAQPGGQPVGDYCGAFSQGAPVVGQGFYSSSSLNQSQGQPVGGYYGGYAQGMSGQSVQSVCVSGQDFSQGQPGGGASGGRGRRFWVWALALCLAVVLVLGLGVGFVFKDRLFGGSSRVDALVYVDGVKTAWEIELPRAEGRRYVEQLAEDKLLLVEVKKTGKVGVSSLALAKGGKPKDKPAVFGDLPKCDLGVDRPFVVKEGKVVCGDSGSRFVKTSEVKGLSDNARVNLGERLRVVSRDDSGALLNTVEGSAVSGLVFVDGSRRVLWERTFAGPVEASVGADGIWVSGESSLSKLVPASKSESQQESAVAKEVLDKKPWQKYCIPDGNICFDYPADYKVKNDSQESFLKIGVYDPKGKQIVNIEAGTLGQFGGLDCDLALAETAPKTEVIEVRDSKLKGLKTYFSGDVSEAKLVSMVAYTGNESSKSYRPYVHLTNSIKYHKVGKLGSCPSDEVFSRVLQSNDYANFGIYYFIIFELGPGLNTDFSYPDVESAKAALDKPEFKVGAKILQSVHLQKE